MWCLECAHSLLWEYYNRTPDDTQFMFYQRQGLTQTSASIRSNQLYKEQRTEQLVNLITADNFRYAKQAQQAITVAPV